MNRLFYRLSLMPLLLVALAVGCYPYEQVSPHPVSLGAGMYLNRTLHNTSRMDAIVQAGAAAGFEWTREEFHWAWIEPAPDDWDYDVLERYDRAVAELTSPNIKILGLLAYHASWSSGEAAPHTDQHRADFAHFAAVMADRYRDTIQHWQIWNEPNIERFWKPEPDAEAYALLLRSAAHAIRAVNPEAVVVGGVTSGVDIPFLRRTVEVAGVDSFDVLSFQPYCSSTPWDRSSRPRELRRLRRTLNAMGWDKPLWVSEFGYHTAAEARGVTEATQAALLVRAALTQFSEGVVTCITYNFVDDGVDPSEKEMHFGMLRHDLSPKPAWEAFQFVSTLLSGAHIMERHDERGVIAVLFHLDGNIKVWAAWDHRVGVDGGVLEPTRGRHFIVPTSKYDMDAWTIYGEPAPLETREGASHLPVDGSPRFVVLYPPGS